MARGMAANVYGLAGQGFRAEKAGATMQEGLYKVEMRTVHGSRRGVLYVWDGKMMGGNSAFAFIGTYRDGENGEVLVFEQASQRRSKIPTALQGR